MYRHRYPTVSTSNLKHTNKNTQIQTEKYKHTNTLKYKHTNTKTTKQVKWMCRYRYLKVRPTQILYLLSQIPHTKTNMTPNLFLFFTTMVPFYVALNEKVIVLYGVPKIHRPSSSWTRLIPTPPRLVLSQISKPHQIRPGSSCSGVWGRRRTQNWARPGAKQETKHSRSIDIKCWAKYKTYFNH